jgi:glycosyltransferase involved in cell wall biosynthesis
MSNDRMTIRTMYPNYYANAWVGHSCHAILESLRECGADVSATVLAKGKGMRTPYVHGIVPRRLLRFLSPKVIDPIRLVGLRFTRTVHQGDVAYVWLGVGAEICDKLRSRGAFVVREMINCTQERRRTELRRAYELLGWPDGSGITDDEIRLEAESLRACDAVYCPSSQVEESVIESGVEESACIGASYGWSEQRIRSAPKMRAPSQEITVLFVGTLDVRKGVPWLLQAWGKAKVRGQLLLAGPVSPEIANRCGDLLAQPNVRCLGHVDNVAPVYDAADIFVLPTWEEGAPLVTLEAMASGLPCVTTPMGTAGALTEREGLIVPPGDVDALADALSRLASNAAWRHELGARAQARAQDFTWAKVGRRRYEHLLAHRERWQPRARPSGWPLLWQISSSGR